MTTIVDCQDPDTGVFLGSTRPVFIALTRLTGALVLAPGTLAWTQLPNRRAGFIQLKQCR